MQQPLQVNHPGKPLSDSYALIAYQTVPINFRAANPHIPPAWEWDILSKTFGAHWEKSDMWGHITELCHNSCNPLHVLPLRPGVNTAPEFKSRLNREVWKCCWLHFSLKTPGKCFSLDAQKQRSLEMTQTFTTTADLVFSGQDVAFADLLGS